MLWDSFGNLVAEGIYWLTTLQDYPLRIAPRWLPCGGVESYQPILGSTDAHVLLYLYPSTLMEWRKSRSAMVMSGFIDVRTLLVIEETPGA